MRHSMLRRKLGAYRAIPWQKKLCTKKIVGLLQGCVLLRGATVNMQSCSRSLPGG